VNGRRITRRIVARTMYCCRDAWNTSRYGNEAPRSCELIVARLTEIRAAIVDGNHVFRNKYASGKILADWDVSDGQITTLTDNQKVRHCMRHWVDGKSWEEAGVFEFYGRKGFNVDDIRMRHERLDAIFEVVRREGRLRCRAELYPRGLREEGGIRIHVDQHGAPLFADGDAHRIAIALILGFETIPAQIGCVHESGIRYVRPMRSAWTDSHRADS
jgi:hypothetical protein